MSRLYATLILCGITLWGCERPREVPDIQPRNQNEPDSGVQSPPTEPTTPTTQSESSEGIMSADEVGLLLEGLGVENYLTNLPEGRIQWTDSAGTTVAYARIKVVISYAFTNRSYLWATEIATYREAGVPMLSRSDGSPGYREGVDESEAIRLAEGVATRDGADFLYRSETGANVFYLAIYDFTPGAVEEGPEAIALRDTRTREFVRNRLELLAETVDSGSDESSVLLDALAASIRQQSRYVVAGRPIADRLEEIATQADSWALRVASQPAEVATEMRQVAHQFNDVTPP